MQQPKNAEKTQLVRETEISLCKKCLLLFTLWVSLGFLRVEVGIIFTSAAILVIIILVLVLLVVITLVIQSLTGEKEDGSGNNSLPDVVANLEVDSEEGLEITVTFKSERMI